MRTLDMLNIKRSNYLPDVEVNQEIVFNIGWMHAIIGSGTKYVDVGFGTGIVSEIRGTQTLKCTLLSVIKSDSLTYTINSYPEFDPESVKFASFIRSRKQVWTLAEWAALRGKRLEKRLGI